MADFKSIKDSLVDTLGTVAEKTKDFADIVASKAKDVSRLAKLNMELNSEKTNMEKTYAEIGKLYYETRKNNPDGFFVQLCDDISLAKENIERIQDEIASLKETNPGYEDGSIEVSFEEVSDEDLAKDADAAPENTDEVEPELEESGE